MNSKTHYMPSLCNSPEMKKKFEKDWEDALQDWKRIKALQEHYRLQASDSLPLEFGYSLILRETLKIRFLDEGEKALLRTLIDRAGIDYTILCYKQREKRKKSRAVQMDMFPQLFEFRMPALPAVQLGKMLSLR